MCYGNDSSSSTFEDIDQRTPTAAEVRKDLRTQIKAAKDVVKGKAKELRDFTKVVTTLEKKLANV